ncbi:MAG: hydrogenase expression/formation protein HypE [Bacteroidales bacterium]|nr:hydrogenase expression/formation protein HypE [Bacteroidales bacterium]
MSDYITLNHGSGGRASSELIQEVFIKSFGSGDDFLTDSAILTFSGNKIAFTTDSFVVNPVFFPGGDIGKLSICGTVNDLAVSGAIPKYISISFILEEGLPVGDLKKITESIALEAKIAKVKIVTGDTKVVPKGKCDKIFINTTGIGIFNDDLEHLSQGGKINPGDKIIVNGTLGDHSVAVLGARNEIDFNVDVKSDCACLNHLIADILDKGIKVKFMRDITRGGLATILNELARMKNLGIDINEKEIPVVESVMGICEILGFDPMYLANEGKVLLVVDPDDADRTIQSLRNHALGYLGVVIGEVVNDHPNMVIGRTRVGGKRIIDSLQGEQIPRIC